ncbi:S-adenosyl-L-methionine-dependent methyltransferase [Aspergillus karnatakaensis]|uniref:S-adenosyl-L-methionine-dependent methyltransferase n=1 Tax=Aspergillus karnatakaensis TaxID=1810916 RepID=UPI003CCD138C
MDKLTLKQRALQIADLATSLANELNETDHPEPTFQHGLPTPLRSDAPPSKASQIYKQLAQTVDELSALLTDPVHHLTHELKLPTASIHPLIRLGIASHFPPHGSSVQDLAQDLGLDESLVRRLLAHSATYHVFYEERKDYFVHTPASRLLAENDKLREWVAMAAEETLPATLKIAQALSQYPDSQEPDQCGWSIANNTVKSAFEAMGSDPTKEKRFAHAMQYRSQQPGFAAQHLVSAFPWPNGDPISKFTVVDIGGGLGHVSRVLAGYAPNATFIVQDTESVVERGKATLASDTEVKTESGERGLQDRVRFQVHDFFTEQPVHGADVYLLRFILHDWSDKYAGIILRALIPAMRKGCKVVLNERVVPGWHERHYLEERRRRDSDMYMLGFQNGRERTVDDLSALLRSVDERFELAKVHQPEGSVLAVVEITWRA